MIRRIRKEEVMELPETKETNLYRHFNTDGVLLYVGISLNAAARLYQHSQYSHWFSDVSNVTIETFPTREEALTAETKAIHDESPKYNIQQNSRKEPEEPKESRKLTKRVVSINPLYTISQAAKILNVSNITVKKMIDQKDIGAAIIGYREYQGRIIPKYIITGWQLIDYIESLEKTDALTDN